MVRPRAKVHDFLMTLLSQAEVARYRERGFVLGPRVISDDVVRELQGEFARVLSEHEQRSGNVSTNRSDRADAEPKPLFIANLSSKAENPVWQIVNIYEASGAFRRLIETSAIVEQVAELLEATTLRIWHDQVQYKPAGRGGVNMWHQDTPYWPIHSGPTAMTAWIALDDADDGNGCMRMVPGSQHWGHHIKALESLPSFDALRGEFAGHPVEVVSCPVPAGSVHFHHGLTWHGSPENPSARPRRAIALHYMSERTLFVPNGEHPMKPFVESAPGEPISGVRFPVVWQAAERPAHESSTLERSTLERSAIEREPEKSARVVEANFAHERAQ
jgi:phytanoyl-CoA hydroxylase